MSRPASAVRAARPLQPATGVCRWLRRPDAKAEGGVLLLNGQPYLVSPIRAEGKRRIADRPILGWKLMKADGVNYDVRLDGDTPSCCCGDWTFNRDHAPTPLLRRCKHLACLAAALPAAGIAVPPAVEAHDPLPDAPGCDGDGFAYT